MSDEKTKRHLRKQLQSRQSGNHHDRRHVLDPNSNLNQNQIRDRVHDQTRRVPGSRLFRVQQSYHIYQRKTTTGLRPDVPPRVVS
jgi:hypothetical protein